ncbi:hypothetical protein [Promicromonospora sp. NPDC050249]|uniref:hypothetical protein n=1 Tax=Promicromonospora sp. NPDC050249 TaxID=3154743 RepID=UPI0033D8B003
MRRRHAALAVVVLGLAACGGPGPEPGGPAGATGQSPGTASAVPDDEPVAAADGTSYDACFDATCEVVVEAGTEIALDEELGWEMPAGLALGGWSLLTVDDVADGSVGLTLSAQGESSGGSTATIITADGTQFSLNGMLVEAVEAPDGRAVLSLAWG